MTASKGENQWIIRTNRAMLIIATRVTDIGRSSSSVALHRVGVVRVTGVEDDVERSKMRMGGRVGHTRNDSD